MGEDILGEDNLGEDNVGEDNVGEDNVGEDNVGEDNVGEDNVGEDNVGEDNVGEDNVGEDNVGEDTVGEDNVGEDNVGEDNVGEDNVGEDGTPEARRHGHAKAAHVSDSRRASDTHSNHSQRANMGPIPPPPPAQSLLQAQGFCQVETCLCQPRWVDTVVLHSVLPPLPVCNALICWHSEVQSPGTHLRSCRLYTPLSACLMVLLKGTYQFRAVVTRRSIYPEPPPSGYTPVDRGPLFGRHKGTRDVRPDRSRSLIRGMVPICQALHGLGCLVMPAHKWWRLEGFGAAGCGTLRTVNDHCTALWGGGGWSGGGTCPAKGRAAPQVSAGVQQRCIGRAAALEEAPEAVRQAVGGGYQSGQGRLLSVTNAIEPGTCRSGDSGSAQ